MEHLTHFSADQYPQAWYGERVTSSANALEFALFRYHRCVQEGIWKEAYLETVKSCERDFRHELMIQASGQARHMVEYMGERCAGMGAR